MKIQRIPNSARRMARRQLDMSNLSLGMHPGIRAPADHARHRRTAR